MSDSSIALTRAIHVLAADLPRFNHGFLPQELPPNGIYLFFERGETVEVDGNCVERIVRIGTHRANHRLPRRLRQHFTGNRRGSVFRRHIGGALLTESNADDHRLPVWINQKGGPVPEVEIAVSEVLRDRFTFSCIRVDDAAERLNLERGLIALLTQRPLGAPSPGWLGRYAVREAVRESGLWNTQHVGAEPLGPNELVRLIEQASVPAAPLLRRSMAQRIEEGELDRRA